MPDTVIDATKTSESWIPKPLQIEKAPRDHPNWLLSTE
jgi:hypothetical protein